MRHNRNRISGFTLIELMISLVIGAIVISAGLSVYVQTSASRNLLRAELALQENSYYIDQMFRQMLNQAGHRPMISSLLSTPLLPVKMPDQSFDEAGGGDSDENWNTGEFIKALSSGIAIRFNGSSDSTGDADGTLIDCEGTSVAEGQTADIAFTVTDGSLFCSSGGTSVELIAEADGVLVERIAILWGLDINNDRSVDEYRTATSTVSAGESILSARIMMLLSSRDEVAVSNSSFSFNGVEYSALDSRLRRETVTTVQFKN